MKAMGRDGYNDPIERHSELAMKAAKRMSHSRHKEKNGRIICQHLLEMLAEHEDDHMPVRRSVRRSVRRIVIEPLQAGRLPDIQYSLLF